VHDAHRSRRGSLAPVVALAVGVWALAGAPLVHSTALQILAAAAFVAALAVIGVHRSRAARGFADPFHPLGFPLIYVAFSFLAPLWLDQVLHTPLRGLGGTIPIAHDTVKLLIIGVVGFAAGASIRFHARIRVPRRPGAPVSPMRLLNAGRLLLLIPLAISFERAAAGNVHHRGVNQFVVSPTDALSALLDPTEIAAVVLILAAHRLAKSERMLARLDWALIGALILLIGLRGSRGNAIALLLVLTLAHVQRRGKVFAVAVGAIVMAVFGVVVLQYRSAAAGHATNASAADILIGDMTVAGFSTGATAEVVPHDVGYAHGATLVAALERQLPSPIAIPLFGPPNDTAARRFRNLVGFDNPNQGIGYSIPAEGYLNFGRFGVFGLCLVLGLAFAWAYARFDFDSARTTRLLYPVLVAVLPFGLRSDSLGLIKSVLYAAILIQVALIVARKSRRTAPVVTSARVAPVRA
jgi:hypothetical protein